jgi:hypothetical protein
MGPSGCGKSSVLAAICRHTGQRVRRFAAFAICKARVQLNGRDLTAACPPTSAVWVWCFKTPCFLPHMTVAENLLFAVPVSHQRQLGQHRTAPSPRATSAARSRAERHGRARPVHALGRATCARRAHACALLAEPQALLARRAVFQTRRRLARPAAPVGVCACARAAHPGGAGHTRRTRRGRPAARGALACLHRRKRQAMFDRHAQTLLAPRAERCRTRAWCAQASAPTR